MEPQQAAEHPNLALIQRINLRDLEESRNLFAEDIVWHYANPNLPDLEGTYRGFAGVVSFFAKIAELSKGSFQVEPVAVLPVGNELVVVHVRDHLTFHGKPITLDVVLIWRIVGGRVTEVWDIVPGQPTEA